MNVMKFTTIALGVLAVSGAVYIGKFDVLNPVVMTGDKAQAVAQIETQSISKNTSTNKNTKSTLTMLGFNSIYGDLPKSLQGTQLQNALETDASGDLIITDSIQYIFDYFLSANGEEDIEKILLRVNEYLEYNLQEPALWQAKTILKQYVDLKYSLLDLEGDMSNQLDMLDKGNLKGGQYVSLLRERLNQRNELRSLYLDSEVHEVFYAQEEAYDEYTYNRLLINSDQSLSLEERQMQTSMLHQALPEEVQDAMRVTLLANDLEAQTQKIIEEGGSTEDIQAFRTELFGEESVQRFEELDKAREDWNQRLSGYMQQREMILANQGLTEAEQQIQVADLRGGLFNSQEQIRVRVKEGSL